MAIDGVHEAEIKDEVIHLKMNDVEQVICGDDYFELNTGSPHYVTFRNSLETLDVRLKGAEIRYNENYRSSGINVNFLEEVNNTLNIRTYERGVEDETFSCGTGVTASAIVYAIKNNFPEGIHLIELQTPGGKLQVKLWKHPDNLFSDIWLIGPAEKVFEGMIAYFEI